VKACPEVTSVVQNVNTRQTNAILGDEEHVLYGPGFILDTLCGLSFRVSSHSFYQVNARQTETLYRIAIDMAARALREGDSPHSAPGGQLRENVPHSDLGGALGEQSEGFALLDAYCGTGTIGLVAASCIENVHVMGVDTVASAIADARLNARHNHIENAEFTCADAGAYLKELAQGGGSLDVLMMDPPRAGASEGFLEAALALRPAHIVYISCNPATQARDIATLVEGGYTLHVSRAVDMFPHTPHIENVVLLSRA
jgi:23S rRNA (uracil1939-C5)-methyltransferase